MFHHVINCVFSFSLKGNLRKNWQERKLWSSLTDQVWQLRCFLSVFRRMLLLDLLFIGFKLQLLQPSIDWIRESNWLRRNFQRDCPREKRHTWRLPLLLKRTWISFILALIISMKWTRNGEGVTVESLWMRFQVRFLLHLAFKVCISMQDESNERRDEWHVKKVRPNPTSWQNHSPDKQWSLFPSFSFFCWFLV